jgi:hypothetical protein
MLVAAAAAAALGVAGYALAGSVTVSLGPAGPQPTAVTADWGDTLAVVNTDTVTYAITSPREDLRADTVAPGATWTSVVTARAGSYQYRQIGGTKSFQGQLVVTATGKVSLTARPAEVVFGQPVQLRGVVTKVGTPVVLEQRSIGDTEWKPVATLDGDASGAFSTSLRLASGARLRASIDGGQVHSANVGVSVLPVLTLTASPRKVAAGTPVSVRVRVKPAAAAARVGVSVCNELDGHWVSSGTKRPSGGLATFRVRLAYGQTQLRAEIARRDAAPGFEARISKKIVVTATGTPPRARKRAPHRC